ncbi:hypothetical protein [Spirillospora sp. NBC_01491]|uniref:hypothetical protein n=1 Tax=Spirillospora sp. NBC_01491 TaxID=2976007 RepID=UPI002E33E02C|nr:hypothetical protein [Spirillospora sp. NBC_01491]
MQPIPKRTVRVRLEGADADVNEATALLALLPGFARGRVRLGEISIPHVTRQGMFRYMDLYILDSAPDGAEQ